MCKWRSSVPEIAVEAVLLRPENEKISVQDAIIELVRGFFVEETIEKATEEVELNVSLAARMFGLRKLEVSVWQASIESTYLYYISGVPEIVGTDLNWDSRIEAFFKSAAEEVANGNRQISEIRPVLEFLTTRIPYASVLMARFVSELCEDTDEEDATC